MGPELVMRHGCGPELVVRHGCGPELVVRHGCGPELVVGSCVHGVKAARLCIGPVLVLRVGLVVDGDRTGSAWYQGWK